MALTDQPYIPLFVDDWMNNNKLKICSPGSHGLMITVMCLMHKSHPYGKLLLKQKFKQMAKQNTKQEYKPFHGFAYQIAKQSSFDLPDVLLYLTELLEEEVLFIEGDYLVNNRMVRDAEISASRAIAGKMGGKATQNKA